MLGAIILLIRSNILSWDIFWLPRVDKSFYSVGQNFVRTRKFAAQRGIAPRLGRADRAPIGDFIS